MKKVLFVLTSHDRKGDTGQATGYYLPEAAHPWTVLESKGFTVDFASPKGGKPPMDGADSPDADSLRFLKDENVSKKIENTPSSAEINPADYKGILFVGGHGSMWDFPNDQAMGKVAAAIYENGGVVGAVCHGPAALVNLTLSDGEHLVKGKQLAAFTDEEERAVELDDVVPFLLASTLAQRGAIHRAAPNWEANVIVDGRLVTGQNPASATGVGREMARLLSAM